MRPDEASRLYAELLAALLSGETPFAALRRAGLACDARTCPESDMEPCRVRAHREWRDRAFEWHKQSRRDGDRLRYRISVANGIGMAECEAAIEEARWLPGMLPFDDVAIAGARV